MEPFETFIASMQDMSLVDKMFQATKAVWRINEMIQNAANQKPPTPAPPKPAVEPPTQEPWLYLDSEGNAAPYALPPLSYGRSGHTSWTGPDGTQWVFMNVITSGGHEGWARVAASIGTTPAPGVAPGQSFPPSTWAKPLNHDGYWDSVADQWNPLVAAGPVSAWDQAMKLDIGGKVSTAAIQQYPQDRAEIQLSYSYAEDNNRGHK